MMMMTRVTREGTGETLGEDVVEEGTPEEDEPLPEPKGRTKNAKGKGSHPSFIFTGPASGGATSISARPTRAEKTLTSTTYPQCTLHERGISGRSNGA